MEITDKLKNLEGFSDLENLEIPGNSNMNAFGIEKINALEKTISEINCLIEERLVLSKEILKEGEILKHEIQSHLELTEKSQIGGTEIAIEKNNLRHKKIEIAELQLNEKLNCWKDISELKKERRIAEKELFEKKERAKMFEKLMENSENANAK